MSALTSEALQLPPAQRLELIEELWNSLRDSDPVELNDADLDELDRRRERYRSNPASLVDWEDVKREFDRRTKGDAG